MQRIAIAVAAALLLVGCGEARQGKYDYVDEPRITPKPRICSDYSSVRQIERDERTGKLTKADRAWLDMDGDGRWCEERGQAGKGEQTQAQ